ncbi:MAG: ABC transporter ATP-binding protein [Mycobacteriales bacterium]
MPGDGSALRCRRLSVAYDGQLAVRDLDLDARPGEIVALLGPSGSGKSTLLQAIAGLVRLSAGAIWVAGRLVADRATSEPPERRDVGMVFQNFALWPHLEVLDTVGYPLRRAGCGRREARERAAELLDLLGLAALAHCRPAELSGGEQQRVGLARALARNARLYLLDEPTAHLDTHLRAAFQAEVRARQRELGAAAVYATHDAAEALGIADTVGLIAAGALIQLGSPVQVYDEPVDAVAARLTGPAGVLAAVIRPLDHDRVGIDVGDARTTAAASGIVRAGPEARALVVRPEWTCPDGPLRGRIEAVWFRGAHTDYEVRSAGGSVTVRASGVPRHGVGDLMAWGIRRVWVLPDADVARSAAQPRANVAPG